jgi:hypothetical protein
MKSIFDLKTLEDSIEYFDTAARASASVEHQTWNAQVAGWLRELEKRQANDAVPELLHCDAHATIPCPACREVRELITTRQWTLERIANDPALNRRSPLEGEAAVRLVNTGILSLVIRLGEDVYSYLAERGWEISCTHQGDLWRHKQRTELVGLTTMQALGNEIRRTA